MTFKKTIGKKTTFRKMTCEKYENALLTAAARNGEPDAKLARHLERCSTCRITLRAERELFARMDSALRAQMSEEARPGFLPRLRAHLSQELTARPGPNRVWHAAGAALALVLMAMFYPLVNGRQASVRQSSVHGNLQMPAMRALRSDGVGQSIRASDDLRAGQELEVRFSHHVKHPAVQNAGRPQPAVLVPPDEREAFAQFVARVAGRDAMAEAVVNPAADNTVAGNIELPGVVPVDMAALQFHGAEQSEWMGKISESE